MGYTENVFHMLLVRLKIPISEEEKRKENNIYLAVALQRETNK